MPGCQEEQQRVTHTLKRHMYKPKKKTVPGCHSYLVLCGELGNDVLNLKVIRSVIEISLVLAQHHLLCNVLKKPRLQKGTRNEERKNAGRVELGIRKRGRDKAGSRERAERREKAGRRETAERREIGLEKERSRERTERRETAERRERLD